PVVAGECLMERVPSGPAAPFLRHLGKDCSERDRDTHAVGAGELLTALKEGRGVDLAGVAITGDLRLDELPLVAVETLAIPSPRVQAAILKSNAKTIRVIPGPISIRNSVMRGLLATNVKDGLLLVKGPVTMTGSTFERAVDFSRTAFLGSVDFSEAVLLREAFFIEGLFDQAARFEKTAFGAHARFHKAQFADTVTFHRAGFSGPAEFIQVSFDKDARFSQTYFRMGTGFSGSHFHGPLDFSEAVFDRAAYFMFTVFDGDAYFRRATFRGEANFADAQFKGVDDFSKVFFNVEPRFTRTKVSGARPSPGGLQDPRFLYGIAAALLVFSAAFILMLRKR
ncbi:MAG: pentapeptide repeat-containing protein, partial [Nitrospiraceae bacterium]